MALLVVRDSFITMEPLRRATRANLTSTPLGFACPRSSPNAGVAEQ